MPVPPMVEANAVRLAPLAPAPRAQGIIAVHFTVDTAAYVTRRLSSSEDAASVVAAPCDGALHSFIAGRGRGHAGDAIGYGVAAAWDGGVGRNRVDALVLVLAHLAQL